MKTFKQFINETPIINNDGEVYTTKDGMLAELIVNYNQDRIVLPPRKPNPSQQFYHVMELEKLPDFISRNIIGKNHQLSAYWVKYPSVNEILTPSGRPNPLASSPLLVLTITAKYETIKSNTDLNTATSDFSKPNSWRYVELEDTRSEVGCHKIFTQKFSKFYNVKIKGILDSDGFEHYAKAKDFDALEKMYRDSCYEYFKKNPNELKRIYRKYERHDDETGEAVISIDKIIKVDVYNFREKQKTDIIAKCRRLKAPVNFISREYHYINGTHTEDPKTGKINVDGDVQYEDNDVVEFSIPYGNINGDFLAVGEKLKTLKNAPQYVSGEFNVKRNRLVSLEGGPLVVGKNYIARENRLTNVIGLPKKIVTHLDLSSNFISTLEGFPQELAETTIINLGNNKLKNLVGLPPTMYSLDVRDNPLVSFEGAPKIITGSFYFDALITPLESWKGFPKKVTTIELMTDAVLTKSQRIQIAKRLMKICKTVYIKINGNLILEKGKPA